MLPRLVDINKIFLADIPGVHTPPAVTIPLSTVVDTGDLNSTYTGII